MLSSRKTIAILGSSRSDGHTKKFLDFIIGDKKIKIINLNDLNISPFDYKHKNQDDDFIPLIKELLAHDIFILATPVYWYTFSAQMKIFIDRLSDLITIEKELGRKLRGKKSLLVSTGSDLEIAPSLTSSFKQICSYLGVKPVKILYHQTN